MLEDNFEPSEKLTRRIQLEQRNAWYLKNKGYLLCIEGSVADFYISFNTPLIRISSEDFGPFKEEKYLIIPPHLFPYDDEFHLPN